MDTTQVHTNVARKDLQPPSTLPLSSQPPSSEVPDEPSTLPVPHPAEGATDPYSPALPSPFEGFYFFFPNRFPLFQYVILRWP